MEHLAVLESIETGECAYLTTNEKNLRSYVESAGA